MANFHDFLDPKNLNEFEKQTRSKLKTSVVSVNLAKIFIEKHVVLLNTTVILLMKITKKNWSTALQSHQSP
jgi:hypothetical protein